MVTEADVRKDMAKRLRDQGWFVVAFSWNKKMPTALKDFPDLACFHSNKTMLIEAKAPGKKRTPGQVRFAKILERLTGDRLVYCCADDWETVEEAMRNAGW